MFFQHLISICSQLTPDESLANKMGETNKQTADDITLLNYMSVTRLSCSLLLLQCPSQQMEVIITEAFARRPTSRTHTLFESSVCFFLPHWFCLLFVSRHWEAFFNARCRSVPNFSIKWVIISYGLLKDKRAFVHLFLQGKSPLPPFSCCMHIRKRFWKTI